MSRGKFWEMAKVIDEVIAHYHQYNELDVPWLAETARRLRAMDDERDQALLRAEAAESELEDFRHAVEIDEAEAALEAERRAS